MSLQFFRPISKPLGARGAIHLAAPLLVVVLIAVVGTFFLVSSNANRLQSTDKTTSSQGKKVKKGYILAYSQEGRFNQVKIVASNTSAKGYKCGSFTFDENRKSTIRRLPKGEQAKKGVPLKIACTPTQDVGHYKLYFGKDGFFKEDNPVPVDVDSEICSLVHFDPTQVRKINAEKGNCKPSGEQDTPKKLDASIRVLPQLSKNKKSIAGFVEISVPAEGVTKAQCSGTVMVTFWQVTPTAEAKKGPFAHTVKFVKANPAKNLKGYCVAGLSGDNLKGYVNPGGTYDVVASYKGSKFFNPAADVTARITIPTSSN